MDEVQQKFMQDELHEKKNPCTVSSPEKKSCIGLPNWSFAQKKENRARDFAEKKFMLRKFARGGGGTPLYGLYGDVPLDRVWFLASSVLNRVYNFMRTCPRQGLNLS